jgi:hypothetical protein
LNRLVRDFLSRLTSTEEGETAADEFTRLALKHGGRSPKGYQFGREAAHRRSG